MSKKKFRFLGNVGDVFTVQVGRNGRLSCVNILTHGAGSVNISHIGFYKFFRPGENTMADIQINRYTAGETAVSYDLTVGKRDIYISIKRDGSYLNVMCKNAAHKAYRGTGRHFWGNRVIDQAREVYQSSEVRSALEFLRRERDL